MDSERPSRFSATYIRAQCLKGLFGLALILGAAHGQGLQITPPHIQGFHPLDDETYASTQLNSAHPVILKLETNLFKDTAAIDFEKRQLTFQRHDSLGYIIWEHHYSELSEYLSSRRNFSLYRSWYHSSLVGKDAAQDKQQNLKLEWELPVQYPGWAQRVLGKEPPKLTIDGSLKITISYEDQRRKDSPTDNTPDAAGPGFNFSETSQFSIRGSIGRLININISANSEEGFDFGENPLKNFKIEYKEASPGELEDEIIQEVIAGYTGFSMPGTNLSGYSESHEGLFGIKIKSRLGPLTLTTIASHEQGESQKLTLSGRAKDGTARPFNESEYIQYRYFFLDTIYRSYYNRKYFNPKTAAPPEIAELQVWKMLKSSIDLSQIQQNTVNRKISMARINGTEEKRHFELLQKDRHYRLYEKEGWIRFIDSVNFSDDDLIAIYMRTRDTSVIPIRGDTTTNVEGKDTVISNLWVLKPQNPIDSIEADTTGSFLLMWKNVFPLDITDLASFQIKVQHVNKDDQELSPYVKETGAYISDVLGLTENQKPLVDRAQIYDVVNKSLIVPPFDSTLMGGFPFDNPRLNSIRTDAVYKYDKRSSALYNYTPTFAIQMSGTSKQTTFDLGWGVMQNTEVVRAGGIRLERGIDYVINYEMGSLELTSPRAKAADDVDVEYQREALFVPEKKVFLGMHGEIKLPFIGDNSFIGGSVLFQDAAASQEIPRIGQEPYSKLLLDVNTKIDFEPKWMTSAVNLIPLIKTDAPSSAVFEVEVAHSRMNPNTSEGKAAYVDDFESSKQSYPLGESHRSWYQASPPYSRTDLPKNPPAWDFYWFSPFSEHKGFAVKHYDIWQREAGGKTTITSDEYEPILRLHCTPAPSDSTIKNRFHGSWAGIMQPISPSFANRTRDQYMEFLLKNETPQGRRGRLRIQFGEMREDLALHGGPPNGEENREDTSRIRVNVSDPNLDLGLDGLVDTAEYYMIPSADGSGWEKLLYRDIRLGIDSLDPSKDNFREYDRENLGNYRYASRTQLDNRLTSEDINYDGTVQTSLEEKYIEFTIDLDDESSSFIDTAANLNRDTLNNWRLYRIPLQDHFAGLDTIKKNVNGADWSKITMVRLIWDGFDSTSGTEEKKLALAAIQLVGNQWESKRDSTGRTRMEASVISTDDNLEYLASLAGMKHIIKRQRDDANRLRREQALRLNFRDLRPGDEALVSRNMSFQALNLSSYDSLTLVVNGREQYPGQASPLYGGNVQFVFRFGTDDSTYYEYRRQINQGWDNYISISLKDLSALKLDWTTQHGDTVRINAGEGSLRVRAPSFRQPNFANILWMAAGVVRDSLPAVNDSLSGELWVNELKVVGIHALNGFAARVNMQTKWADLFDVSARADYEGGNFRRMTENSIGAENTDLSGSVGANMHLDKFLPQEWQVSIPVGATLSGSLSRPQLKPNTDIYLTKEDGEPDGLKDMIADAANMALGQKTFDSDTTESEHFEKQSITQTIFTNYSKSSTSKNPLVHLTADRINTEFQYNMSAHKTGKGERPEGDSDYVEIDTTRNYIGRLRYDLTPRDPASWTKWKPLGESKSAWVPRQLKEYELNLLPSKITFLLADVNYGNTYQRDTKIDIEKKQRTFDLRHDFQLDYSPIRPLLDLGYSLGVNRDLRDHGALNNSDSLFHAFRYNIFEYNKTWEDYLVLFGEKGRTQRATTRLDPRFFDWLSHSADYSADYRGDISRRNADSTDYLNVGIKSGLNFNSSFNFDDILNTLATSKMPGIGSFFGVIDKGFEKIAFRSVSFTYSATSDLKNDYLDASELRSRRIDLVDYMSYSFGLKGRGIGIITGDMDDRTAMGGMRYRTGIEDEDLYQNDIRSVKRTYSLSTSMNLPSPFEVQFTKLSFGWSTEYKVRPDTLYYDTIYTLPDLSLSASSSSLEKFEFIKTWFQRMNLTSGYSFRRSRTNSSAATDPDTTTVSDWSPLISVDGTFRKQPITFDYRHNNSIELKKSGKNLTKTTKDGDNFSIKYQIEQSSKLSEIKLFGYTIPIRGRTNMGCKGTREYTIVEVKENETAQKSLLLSITPHLSYIFTDNVTGTLEYTWSKNENTDNSEIISNIASLIVEIRF